MATKAKSSPRTPKIVHGWKPNLIRILIVIGIPVLVLQIVFDFAMYERVVRTPSGEPLTSMIIDAATALHKPAVIDPISKNVYLPDANLVLPPQAQDMPNLVYSYNPAAGSSSAEADVTVTNAMSVAVSRLRNAEGQGMLNHNSNKLFDAVPGLQVCARGVHIVFSAQTTYTHLQFTRTLADGRTMYVYTEEQSCAYSLQPLVEYLKDAQSY